MNGRDAGAPKRRRRPRGSAAGQKNVKNDKKRLNTGKKGIYFVYSDGEENKERERDCVADIFVSYAHLDRDRACHITDRLREHGWDIWQDVHNLRPMCRFTEEIAKAIRDCSVFLLLFSDAYYKSSYCGQEFAYAFDSLQKNAACVILDEDCQWIYSRFAFNFSEMNVPGFGRSSRTAEELEALADAIEDSVPFIELRRYRDSGETGPMQLIGYENRPKVRLRQRFGTVREHISRYWNGQGYDEDLKLCFTMEGAHRKRERDPDAEEETQRQEEREKAGAEVLFFLKDMIPEGRPARAVITGNGGLGKTTEMIRYGEGLLDARPVVCVHLTDVHFDSSYDGQFSHIERYIHDNICVEEGTWRYIVAVGKRVTCDGYRLTILLDGINELPEASMQTALREIGRISSDWTSSDLIVSARSGSALLNSERGMNCLKEFTFYRAVPPTDQKVRSYLSKYDIAWEALDPRTRELLRNPLRLTIYARTQPHYERYRQMPGLSALLHTEQDTPGKILDNYLASQLYRFLTDNAEQNGGWARITAFVVGELVYPYIGWKLMKEERFDITEGEIRRIFTSPERSLGKAWESYMSGRMPELAWGFGYGEEYRWNPVLAKNVMLSLAFLVPSRNDGEETAFYFPHQLIRDYFAARFLADDIRLHNGTESGGGLLLAQGSPGGDGTDLVSDILQEERAMPFLRPGQGWVFPGKEGIASKPSDLSEAEKALDLFRGRDDDESRAAVSALVRILAYARRGRLACCRFDGLDMRDCRLRDIEFSLWYRDSLHTSSFDGAWIDLSSFSCDSHRAPVNAVCDLGNGSVLSGDMDGILLVSDARTGKLTGKRWQAPERPIRSILHRRDTATIVLAAEHSIYQLDMDSGAWEKLWHNDRTYLDKLRFGPDGSVQYCVDIVPMVWTRLDGTVVNGGDAPLWLSAEYDVRYDGKMYWRSGMMRNLYAGTRAPDGTWQERNEWLLDLFPTHAAACSHVRAQLEGLNGAFSHALNKKDRETVRKIMGNPNWEYTWDDPRIPAFRKRMRVFLGLPAKALHTPEGKEMVTAIRREISELISDVPNPNPNGNRISGIFFAPDGDTVLVTCGSMLFEFDAYTMAMLKSVQMDDVIGSVCFLAGESDAYIAVGWSRHVTVLDREMNIVSSCRGEPQLKTEWQHVSPTGEYYVFFNDGRIRRLDRDLRVDRIRMPDARFIRKVFTASDGKSMRCAFPLEDRQWPAGELYDFDTDSYAPLSDDYYQDWAIPPAAQEDRKNVVYFLKRSLLIIPPDAPENRRNVPFRGGFCIFGCSFRNVRGELTGEDREILYMNGGIME